MQPQTSPTQTDGFKPKWRHFHPLSRVWVQNPFDHDVVYQVADERNRPFKYRLPAGKVSELPGGAIATLGVKAIVDELIQNSKEDSMRMWDENVRSRHEADIILRLKETKEAVDSTVRGEIDLGVKGNDVPETQVETAKPEQAFPGLNQPEAEAVEEPKLAPLPPSAAAGLNDVIAASLPRTDAVAKPNNANTSAEG